MNLQHDKLVEVAFYGPNVTSPPPAGGAAPIIVQLGGDSQEPPQMPQGRPKLDPDGDEFQLVNRWVTDGRPE